MFRERFWLIVKLCAVPWGLFWLIYLFFIDWNAWFHSLPEIVRVLLALLMGAVALGGLYLMAYLVVPYLIIIALAYIFPPVIVLGALLAVAVYYASAIIAVIAKAAIENIATVVRGIGHVLLLVSGAAALVCLSVWHGMFICMLLTPVLVFVAYYLFIVYGPNPEGDIFEQLRRDKLAFGLAQEELSQSLYDHKKDGMPSILQSLILAEKQKALNMRVKEENIFLEGIIEMIRKRAHIQEEEQNKK